MIFLPSKDSSSVGKMGVRRGEVIRKLPSVIVRQDILLSVAIGGVAVYYGIFFYKQRRVPHLSVSPQQVIFIHRQAATDQTDLKYFEGSTFLET